jgi:hypothetical protein
MTDEEEHPTRANISIILQRNAKSREAFFIQTFGVIFCWRWEKQANFPSPPKWQQSEVDETPQRFMLSL